jgi:hypothetical protein
MSSRWIVALSALSLSSLVLAAAVPAASNAAPGHKKKVSHARPHAGHWKYVKSDNNVTKSATLKVSKGGKSVSDITLTPRKGCGDTKMTIEGTIPIVKGGTAFFGTTDTWSASPETPITYREKGGVTFTGFLYVDFSSPTKGDVNLDSNNPNNTCGYGFVMKAPKPKKK